MNPALSRRGFLKWTGAGALAGATSGCLVGQSSPPMAKGTPKNLIFLVSDGMNVGTLSMANHFAEAYQGGACEWIKLYRPGVVRSLVETSSASSLVTDSAAAGSAWSCGERINNGALNIAPDGRVLTPLYEHAKKVGKATGVVTTTRVTHATPASFMIREEDRNAEDAIARKFLSGTADIILGGGSRHFDPAKREDGQDLFAEFKSQGYAILRNRDDLIAAMDRPGGERWLGTFFGSHLPYTIDREHQSDLAETVPTLAEMMRAALIQLAPAREGFFLQVEGGRVDHAGHANDGAAIIKDQLAFDECIRVALDFVARDPDTLVIVTTDHGTGGANLNGMGERYNDTTQRFANTRRVKASFEYLAKQVEAETTPSAFRELVGENFGVSLANAAAQAALTALAEDAYYDFANAIAPAMFDFTGISFTSNAHTGDHVELLALGPGADAIPPYHENYQLVHILRKQFGLGG